MKNSSSPVASRSTKLISNHRAANFYPGDSCVSSNSTILPPIYQSRKRSQYRSESFSKPARHSHKLEHITPFSIKGDLHFKIEDIIRHGAISIGMPSENNRV